jgi:hypothetical protein
MMGIPNGHTVGGDGTYGYLERLEDDDGLTGFQIVGLGAEAATSVPLLPRLRAMGLEDDSELNLIRIDGLCRIISSLWAQDLVNTEYRLTDAMADFLVSGAARRLPWWPVPQIARRSPGPD